MTEAVLSTVIQCNSQQGTETERELKPVTVKVSGGRQHKKMDEKVDTKYDQLKTILNAHSEIRH